MVSIDNPEIGQVTDMSVNCVIVVSVQIPLGYMAKGPQGPLRFPAL